MAKRSEASEGAAKAGAGSGATSPRGSQVEQSAQPSPEPPEQVRPVGSLREATMLLRAPFTPEAVGVKVQSQFQGGVIVVFYIDARLVTERLNLIVPTLWSEEYEAVGNNLLLCKLTVDGVTHQDVGEGVGKALYSDALKRAAVRFGIGVSIYAVPVLRVKRADAPDCLYEYEIFDKKTQKKKKVLGLTGEGERRARDYYRRWLEQKGVEAFGAPIDHGDVEGAAGDHEVPAEEQDADLGAEPEQPQLTDEDAEAKRAEARSLYDDIRGLKADAILPGSFNAMLTRAGTSHEGLDELLVELANLRTALRESAPEGVAA